MADLLDGRHVPWHAASGKREPEPDDEGLPPPVRREPYTVPAGTRWRGAIAAALRIRR